MRTLVLLLSLLLVAACSGADRPAPTPPPASGTSLKETCPQVERALRGVDTSSAASLHDAAARVRALAAAGDAGTRAALDQVVAGLRRPGSWTATLGQLASACAAAGSPVFR